MIEITGTVEEIIAMQRELKAAIDRIVDQQTLYRQVKEKYMNLDQTQCIKFKFPMPDEAAESFDGHLF